MKTAWIAGATGLVGGHALRPLLESYDRVVAFTRRPLPIEHNRLEIASIDSLQAGGTVDDVFCALGTTIRKAGSREAFRRVDLDLPLRIADAAAGQGAKQFLLVSSVGASSRSSNFYLRVKGELEDRLTGFHAVHIFRPSVLIGNRGESRPAEKLGIALAAALQFALAGPLRIYRPIEARTVGEAMVAAALQDLAGRHVYHFDDIIRAAGR